MRREKFVRSLILSSYWRHDCATHSSYIRCGMKFLSCQFKFRKTKQKRTFRERYLSEMDSKSVICDALPWTRQPKASSAYSIPYWYVFYLSRFRLVYTRNLDIFLTSLHVVCGLLYMVLDAIYQFALLTLRSGALGGSGSQDIHGLVHTF